MSELLAALVVALAFAAFALLSRRAGAGEEPGCGACDARRGCAGRAAEAPSSTSECPHADR